MIAVAAQDHRVAAVVSQCPFTDALASLPKLGAANIARATVAGIRDLLRAATGRQPYYIPAVGRPGVVRGDDDARLAMPGFERADTARDDLGEPGRRRIARADRHLPAGRFASQISCPVLFCLCDTDSLAPAKRSATLVGRRPARRSSATRSATSTSTSASRSSRRSRTRPSSSSGTSAPATASAQPSGDRLEHAPDPAHH